MKVDKTMDPSVQRMLMGTHIARPHRDASSSTRRKGPPEPDVPHLELQNPDPFDQIFGAPVTPPSGPPRTPSILEAIGSQEEPDEFPSQIPDVTSPNGHEDESEMEHHVINEHHEVSNAEVPKAEAEPLPCCGATLVDDENESDMPDDKEEIAEEPELKRTTDVLIQNCGLAELDGRQINKHKLSIDFDKFIKKQFVNDLKQRQFHKEASQEQNLPKTAKGKKTCPTPTSTRRWRDR